jgi:hypothetical protein
MDMRYYWIQDRTEHGQFDVRLAPGADKNLGDYFTEHHSPSHHKRILPFYIHSQTAPMIFHNTKRPVLRGVLIFALSPRMSTHPYPVWAPIHAIIQGGICAVAYQHYGPPIPAQTRATHVMRPYLKCATQQHYTIAQCVSTTSDIQLQNTSTSHYSAARIRTTSGRYTPIPHYSSVSARTPSGSLVYHHLFPRSGLSYSHCNTRNIMSFI